MDAGEAAAGARQLGADSPSLFANAVALEALRLGGIEEHLAAVSGIACAREGQLGEPLLLGARAPGAKPQVELRAGSGHLDDHAVHSLREHAVKAIGIWLELTTLVVLVGGASVEPDLERPIARGQELGARFLGDGGIAERQPRRIRPRLARRFQGQARLGALREERAPAWGPGPGLRRRLLWTRDPLDPPGGGLARELPRGGPANDDAACALHIRDRAIEGHAPLRCRGLSVPPPGQDADGPAQGFDGAAFLGGAGNRLGRLGPAELAEVLEGSQLCFAMPERLEGEGESTALLKPPERVEARAPEGWVGVTGQPQ